MKTHEEVQALVKAAFASRNAAFRPYAFFDDRLDCIRVVARDCSSYEKRLNSHFTVMIDNYHSERPQERKYVGFTIKGVRHFCQEHHLPLSMPIKMATLIDAIVASVPDGLW